MAKEGYFVDLVCRQDQYKDKFGDCKACSEICNPGRGQLEDCENFCPEFLHKLSTGATTVELPSLPTAQPQGHGVSSDDTGHLSLWENPSFVGLACFFIIALFALLTTLAWVKRRRINSYCRTYKRPIPESAAGECAREPLEPEQV